MLVTTASGCAAINYAVASGDTGQLVWCWRKERQNRDDVLVLCHPPQSVSFILQTTNHCCTCRYTRIVWYIAAAEGRGQSLRTDMHLVSSYFVAKLYIPQTIKIVSFLYRHISAASPASMTSSTVASFLQDCSALSLNNALEVNLFSNNPFPRPYSLDVVSHTNIA